MLRANRDASYEAIPDPDDTSAAARRHASLQAKIAQFNELQQRRRQLMLNQGDGLDEKDAVDGPNDDRDESWIEVIETRDRLLANNTEILPPGVFSPPTRKMRRGDRRRSTLSTISSDADDDSAMHRYSEYEPGPGVYTEPPSRQNEHIMMHPNLRSSFECLYDSSMEVNPLGLSSLERRGRSGSLLSGLRSLESLQGDWEAEELEARRWRDDDEGSTSTASAASFVRLPAQLRLPQPGESPMEVEQDEGIKTPRAEDGPIEETVVKSQEASVPHIHPDDRPIFPGEAPKRPQPRVKPNVEPDRKRYARSTPQPPKRRSVQFDDDDEVIHQQPVMEDVERPEVCRPSMLDSRRSRDSLGDDLEALRRRINDDEYSEDNRSKSPVTAPLKEPLGSESDSPVSASSSAFPFQQETNSSVPQTKGMRMSDRQAISKRPSLSEMRQRFESLSQSSDTNETAPTQSKTDPIRRPLLRRPSGENRASLSSNDFGPRVELGSGKNTSKPWEARDSVSSVDLSETPNSTLPKRHSQMDSSFSSDDPNSLDASGLRPVSQGSGSRASEPRESPGLKRYEDKIKNQPAVAAFVQLAGESDPKLTRFHAWSNSHPTQEYIVNAATNETNINMSIPLREPDTSSESEIHRSSFQMMTKDDRQSRKPFNGNQDSFEDQILPSNAISDQHTPQDLENPGDDVNSSNKSKIPRFYTAKGDPSQEDIVQENLAQKQPLAHGETSEPSGNKLMKETPGQMASRIPRRKHGVPPPLPERHQSLIKEPSPASDNVPNAEHEFPSNQQNSRIPRRHARNQDSNQPRSNRSKAIDDDANSSSDEYYGTPKSHHRFPQSGPLASRNDDPKKMNRKDPHRSSRQSMEPRVGDSYVTPLNAGPLDRFQRSDSDIEPEFGRGGELEIGPSTAQTEPDDSHFQTANYPKREGYVLSLANELKDPSLFETQENRLPHPVHRKSIKEQRDSFFGVNGEVPNAVEEDSLSPYLTQKLQSSLPQHGQNKEIYETSLDDIDNDEIPTESHPELPVVSPPPYLDAVRFAKVKNQRSLDSEGPNDQSSDYDTLQATWSRAPDPTPSKQKVRQNFEDKKNLPSDSVEEFIDHVYRSKGSPDRTQRLSGRPFANEDSQFSDGFSSDTMHQASPERPPYFARRVDPRSRSSRDQRNRIIPQMMSNSPPPDAYDDDARRGTYDNVPVSRSDPHAPRREPGPPPRSGKDHGQNRNTSSSPPPPLPQRMKKPANDASKITGTFPVKPNSRNNQNPSYLGNNDPHRNVPGQTRQPDQFHYDPRYSRDSNNPFIHQRTNQDPSKKPQTTYDRQPHFQRDRDPNRDLMTSSGEYPSTEDSAQNHRDLHVQGQMRSYPLGRHDPKNDLFQPQFPEQYDLHPYGRYDTPKSTKGVNGRPEQANFRGSNQHNNRFPNQSRQEPFGKPNPFDNTRDSSKNADVGNPHGRDMSRYPQDDRIFPDHLIPQQSQLDPRQRGERAPKERSSRPRHPSTGSGRSGQFALPNDLIYPTSQRPENAVRGSHDGAPARPPFPASLGSDDPERRPLHQPELRGGYSDPRNQPHSNFRTPASADNRNPGHLAPQYPQPISDDPPSAAIRSNPNQLSRSFDPMSSGELHNQKPEIPGRSRPFDPAKQTTDDSQYDNWNQSKNQQPQSQFIRQQPVRRRERSVSREKSSDTSNRSEPASVQQDFEFDPVTCQFIPRSQTGHPSEQSSQVPRHQPNQPNPADVGWNSGGQNLVFDPVTGQFVPVDSERLKQFNQQHPDAFHFNSPHPTSQRDPNNTAPQYQKNVSSQPGSYDQPLPSQTSAPYRNFSEPQANHQRPRHPSGYDSASSQPKDGFDPQMRGRHHQQHDRQYPGALNTDHAYGGNPSSRYPNHPGDSRYPRYRLDSGDRDSNINHNNSQPDISRKQPQFSSNPVSYVQSGPSNLRESDHPQNAQPEQQITQAFSKGVSNQPLFPHENQSLPSRQPQSNSYPTPSQPELRRASRRHDNSPGRHNLPNEMPSVRSSQEQPTRGGPDRTHPPYNQLSDRYPQKPGQRPLSYPAANQRDPRYESRRPEIPPGPGWYKDIQPDRQGLQHSRMEAPTQATYPQEHQAPQFSRNNVQQSYPNSSQRSNQFDPQSEHRRPRDRNAPRLSNRSSSPSSSDKRSGLRAKTTSPVPSSRPPLPPADDPTQFIDHKYLSLGRLPPHHQRVPEGPQFLSDIIVPSSARTDQNEPPAHPGASYQLRSNPGALTQLVHSSRRDREGTPAQRATKPNDPDNIRRVQRTASDVKAAPPPLPPKAVGKVARSSSSVTSSRSDVMKTEEAAKLERLRATFEEAEKRLGDLGNREEDAEERREYFWRQMASLQKSEFSWDDTDEWVTDAAKESPWALLKDPGDLNDPVAELERMYLDLDLDRDDLMERAERRVVPDSLYDRFIQLRAELPPSEETHEAPPSLNHRLPSDSDDPVATPSNCSTLRSNATSSRSVPHIPHRSPYPHKVRDDKAYRRLHPNVTAPTVSKRNQSVSGSSRATPHGGTTPALSRRESDAGQHSSSTRSTLSRSHSLGRQSDVLAQPSPTSADYLLPRSTETLDQRKQWPPRYAEEPDPKLDDMAYRRLVRSSNSVKSNNHKSLLGKERPAPFTAIADTFASSIRSKPKTPRQTKLVAIRTRARIEETSEGKRKSGGTTPPGCGRRDNLIQLVTWL